MLRVNRPLFDSIVCDPPYGVRARTQTVGVSGRKQERYNERKAKIYEKVHELGGGNKEEKKEEVAEESKVKNQDLKIEDEVKETEDLKDFASLTQEQREYRAIRNYELFNCMEKGTATLE